MPVAAEGVGHVAEGNVTCDAWTSIAPRTLANEHQQRSMLGNVSWKTAGLKKSLGPRVAGGADLEPFWRLAKVRAEVRRGEIITSTSTSRKHFTVLLSGLACMTTRHVDGARQIYAFHHPGDFLALHGFLYPESTELIEVEALSNCSFCTINRDVLERTMQDHLDLGQMLWRAAMNEASVFRQRLLMARWPAQQRVAHLLCEQLSRLGAKTSVIPLSQIDVADTVGLSVVHTNRVLQDLRKLGVLSDKRCIEVADKKRLQELCAFDGGYLNPSETLSRWDVRFED